MTYQYYRPSWLNINSPERTTGSKVEKSIIAGDLKRLYKKIIQSGNVEESCRAFHKIKSKNSSDISVLLRNIVSTIVSGELEDAEPFKDKWEVHIIITKLQHEEEIARSIIHYAEKHNVNIDNDDEKGEE